MRSPQPGPAGVTGDDSSLRRAFLLTMAIPLVFIAAMWVLIGAPTLFVGFVLPVVVVCLALLLAGVWTRRLPLHLVGPMLFVIPSMVIGSRLLLWVIGVLPESGELGDVLSESVWIAILFPLAFLIFGTRRGLQVSLFVYVLFLLLTGNRLLATYESGTDDPLFVLAMSLPAIFPVLISALWVLASRLESLVAERARAEFYAEQALTDPLTGIANRRRLDDDLEQMIERARRYGDEFSAVLIDLDNFKRVNDTFGHVAGDRVLVEVVQRMSSSVRDSDLVGRWGGEEFLILAPHTGYSGAVELAERCRRSLASAPLESGPITASYGVATFDGNDDTRTLLRRADLGMFTAKSQGGDQVVGIPALEDAADAGEVESDAPCPSDPHRESR